MKLSYNWLKEFIRLYVPPNELASHLTEAGLEVDSIEPYGEDTILELSITANRGDCLSILGLAREVALITGQKLKIYPAPAKYNHNETADGVDVTIEDQKACPRYLARLIRGAAIGPSPDWLRDRLEAAGLRSLNNIVDATNYVLWELGQPLHAFDFDRISGGKIVVRRAKAGERLAVLDGGAKALEPQMLVIADAHKPVALAGVIGGEETGVNPATQNVLLECAYFEPAIIRRTARKLGITTESSFRFERGVDPDGLPKALDRVTQLILELAGGEVVCTREAYPNPIQKPTVKVRFSRVNKLLGTDLSSEEITGIIRRVGVEMLAQDAEGLLVRSPSFRSDLTREADFIEEVARIYGYQRIPVTVPAGYTAHRMEDGQVALERRARRILVGCGFGEAINFSFTNSKTYSKLGVDWQGLTLANPLSLEHRELRSKVIPSLLENLAYNARRQLEGLRLFELSVCYEKTGGRPKERRLLGGVMCGPREPEFWGSKAGQIDFYDVKGVAETLLESFGLSTEAAFTSAKISMLEQAAQIELKGEPLGYLGKLKGDLLQVLDLKQPVYLFELDFSLLAERAPSQLTYTPLAKYPAAVRDVAVVVADDLPVQAIVDAIWELGQSELREVKLFDLYKGRQVAPGCRSLAFSLSYQSRDRTLTEDEVSGLFWRVAEELRRKFGAQIRDAGY